MTNWFVCNKLSINSSKCANTISLGKPPELKIDNPDNENRILGCCIIDSQGLTETRQFE